MIAIVWQFEVRSGHNADFEAFYGVNGAWTLMNRRSRSYLGSSFLRDQTVPARYLMVEYWSEMLIYERHLISHRHKIDELEARRSALVESMEPLGVFTALDVPDRSGPTWSQRR
jgi:quinol monooxygenase YgiN